MENIIQMFQTTNEFKYVTPQNGAGFSPNEAGRPTLYGNEETFPSDHHSIPFFVVGD